MLADSPVLLIAENQAAALAGAETQVMLRMLQQQVQQQQQQLAAAQEAVAAAAAVPGLQQALTAAREQINRSRGPLAELQRCKQQVEHLQNELALFKTAFKVKPHHHCYFYTHVHFVRPDSQQKHDDTRIYMPPCHSHC